MKRISFVSLAIILTLALSLMTAPLTPVKASPGIITVPDDYSTITEAVSNAIDYDTIQVRPGTYNEEITVIRPLTIEGIGSGLKTLQGPGTGTGFGIYVHNTHDVTVRNLTIQGYRTGIFLHNSHNNDIINNTSQNNTASGSINGCGIETQGSDNNTITDNTFLNNEYGINLYNADLNYLVNNTSQHNEYGLYLKYSHSNVIDGNDFSFNTSRGTYLQASSNNNISGNTISSNDIHGIELYGLLTDNNTINNNDICNNVQKGISVNTRPQHTVITGNNICDNLQHGIFLFQDAGYTEVYYNNIMNNQYGIWAYGAHYSEIYNNNFINNFGSGNIFGKQAYAATSGNIKFNLPDPTGGNYWSDHTSPDVIPPPNGDGFVDNPYTFPPMPAYYGTDYLPWAEPDGWLAKVQGYKWEDLDGNGEWDQGEPAMPGVTIYADLSQDDVLDESEPSTVTDDNGWYSIAGLPTGVGLQISEVVPEDYLQTFPLTSGFWGVNLSPGQVMTGLDFGNRMPEITVQIDIKPGSNPNSINLNSKGVIPVAILTEGGFDTASVNATTVCFGKEGDEAEPVHYSLEDVDDDGDMDMIFHFKTQDIGLEAEDTEAILTGQTTDGIEITGTDSVRIVPPKGKGKANKGSKPEKGGGQDNGNGNPNPGQGNNQGGGNDNPNSGQGNNQGGENGNSNPGQGKGKGKGNK